MLKRVFGDVYRKDNSVLAIYAQTPGTSRLDRQEAALAAMTGRTCGGGCFVKELEARMRDRASLRAMLAHVDKMSKVNYQPGKLPPYPDSVVA